MSVLPVHPGVLAGTCAWMQQLVPGAVLPLPVCHKAWDRGARIKLSEQDGGKGWIVPRASQVCDDFISLTVSELYSRTAPCFHVCVRIDKFMSFVQDDLKAWLAPRLPGET